MKKFLIPFFLFSVVFMISAAPPILRQFGTTNTPTVLTNIIQSLAGGGSQVWTNDADLGMIYPVGVDPFYSPIVINRTNGGITVGTNTYTVYNLPKLNDILYSVFDPSAGDPSFSRIRQEIQNYNSGNSFALWESKITQGASFPKIETQIRSTDGTEGISQFLTLDFNTTNILWNIASTVDGNLVYFKPYDVDSPFIFSSPKVGAASTLAQFTSRITNVFKITDSAGISMSATTNHIIFGATNTAPSSAVAPTKWISVRINGESKEYRIPLYE